MSFLYASESKLIPLKEIKKPIIVKPRKSSKSKSSVKDVIDSASENSDEYMSTDDGKLKKQKVPSKSKNNSKPQKMKQLKSDQGMLFWNEEGLVPLKSLKEIKRKPKLTTKVDKKAKNQGTSI